jgi:peptidoglycan/LPS O-acetylase OafA/YrhL
MPVIAECKSNNFDTLRLVFAVFVIFSHSFPVILGTDRTEPLSRLTRGHASFGSVAVWSFFIISGFLITQSWLRSPNLLRFLSRRVLRIYPGFIVATFLCAVLVHPIASPDKLSVLSYIRSTLHLQLFNDRNAFPRNPVPGLINASMWSISSEFWCYIAAAVLGITGLLSRRFVAVGILLVFLLFDAIAIDTYHVVTGFKVGVFLGMFPFFQMGSLIYLFAKEIPIRHRYAVAAALLLIGSLYVPHATIFAFPIFGSYLVMWFAYLPALHPLHLGRWGDFSYGTYLYAYPIQQLFAFYFLRLLNPLLLFAIATPLSILAGFLSWHLVEKHFLLRNTVRKLEENPSYAKSAKLSPTVQSAS